MSDTTRDPRKNRKDRWVKFDGYDERHQLINILGQIVGEVTGSTFHRDSGWIAILELSTPSVNLGRYNTLENAKIAVEQAIQNAIKKGKHHAK